MTKPTLVEGDSTIDAWHAGGTAINSATGREIFNLVTLIKRPDIEDRTALTRYNPKSAGGRDTVFGVAGVLFPLLPRGANESAPVYLDRCERVIQRARRKGLFRGGWGTYFERLHRMDGADCQITRAVRAYSTWPNRSRAAVVMHVSSPRIDHLRVQGAPCLQFIEITAPSETKLDLVAVYRNHDFIEKALGNFVGLARLLRFICASTGNGVGSVICHSVHAYSTHKGRLQALLDKYP